jgi:hypothetical protein
MEKNHTLTFVAHGVGGLIVKKVASSYMLCQTSLTKAGSLLQLQS